MGSFRACWRIEYEDGAKCTPGILVRAERQRWNGKIANNAYASENTTSESAFV